MNRPLQAPHSTEAEAAVLGALLASSGSAYDRVADILSAGDMYHQQHSEIFSAITSLVLAGKPADSVTVCEWLRANRVLQKSGGREYVEEIAHTVAKSANVRRYAELVVEKRMARQLLDAAQRLQEIAYEPGDIHQRMDQAQALVMSLNEASRTNEPQQIDQVLAETIQWVEERHDSGEEITGLATGIDNLDKKTSGLQDGDLIVIAGRPAMGKTALALNVAENVAEAGGEVLVFTLEMSKLQLGMRTLASRGSVDLNRIRTPSLLRDGGDDWSRMVEAMERMSGKKMFIDDTAALTVPQMHARARRMKRKLGNLRLVVIDYLQLMGGNADDRRSGDGRVQVVSEISRGLKLMAKDLGCPVIALSQLHRGVESRADKRPLMSDLRESGSIEQDADVILLMYRDDYYNENSKYPNVAEANIAKQRMGPTGRVGMLFQKPYSRFSNYDGALPDGSDDYGGGRGGSAGQFRA
jgi:replicative DNA helicase